MSRVVIHDAALHRLLRSRTGPVGKIIDDKAHLIFQLAAQNIAMNFDSRTGDLAASLRKVPLEDSDGYHVVVGADAEHRGYPYARALELGINPFTGEETIHKAFPYMVPAVESAGFKRRRA